MLLQYEVIISAIVEDTFFFKNVTSREKNILSGLLPLFKELLYPCCADKQNAFCKVFKNHLKALKYPMQTTSDIPWIYKWQLGL